MSDAAMQTEDAVSPHQKRTLNVKYFAVLRDKTGKSEEQLRTRADTPSDLFEEIDERYDVNLDPDPLQVAVNHQLSTWDAPLGEGDTVAFLPPVSGG